MSGEGAASPPPERPLAKEAMWHLLNLAVLWTFAVAQPLFDLLGDNPEFFAARGSSGFDIISFSVLLVVLPPLLLLAIELLLGLAGRRVFRAAHLVFLASARHAHSRAGAEEVHRRVGRRADRAVRGHRGCAGRPLRPRGGAALLPQHPVARATRVPAAVPDRVPGVEAGLPRRGGGAHHRRRHPGADRGGAAGRAAVEHAGGRARPPGHQALPGLRRAGPQRHVVQERVHDLRLHGARAAGDHGRGPAGQGPPADLGRPSEQHLLAVRQDPPAERVRGGHLGVLARPVQGLPPGRALRGPHLLDERGPRAGVAARGVAAGDRGGPRLGVRQLGRLRWRQR